MAVLRKERKGNHLNVSQVSQKGPISGDNVKSEQIYLKAFLFTFIKGHWAIISLVLIM